MTHQTAIPFMQLRGGSSKGVYFREDDLPADIETRDEVLKWVMGAYGDPRQIDGLGGADPLTSKIAIVRKSERQGCDLDYLFIQAIIGEDRLDDTPNCGNILAGVGAFALESGLLPPLDDAATTADITVYMSNSGNQCRLSFPVENGYPVYQGEARIDGVAGSAAPVICHYQDLEGSATGALLPTGNMIDEFDGVYVTCIDNGMPVVCLRAEDFDITGYESPDALNANEAVKAKLESIRLAAGRAMGLGDVSAKAVPKMCLIAPAREGGAFCTRTFIPKQCHKAIGVLGAVSAATAALFPKGAVHDLAQIPDGLDKLMRIEHPTGSFDVQLSMADSKDDNVITGAGLLRTARLISKGEVFIPHSIWQKEK